MMDEVSEALRTFRCQAEGSRQLIGPKPPRSRGRFDKSRSMWKEEHVTRERADVGERSEHSRSRSWRFTARMRPARLRACACKLTERVCVNGCGRSGKQLILWMLRLHEAEDNRSRRAAGVPGRERHRGRGAGRPSLGSKAQAKQTRGGGGRRR